MDIQKRVPRVLFGTLLLDMIGFGMVFPIIPIIFTDPTSPAFLLAGHSRSSQLFIAGAITALWGLMQFIAAPILGELSDIHGRKKLLLFGVGILGVSQFLFGFGIATKSLLLLFVARAIAGIAAGNVSIAQASIADVTDPKDRAKNFGLIGAAVGLGLILGPLLSGWIAGLTHNPASPFFMAGILGVLNVTFVAFLLPETNLQRKLRQAFTLIKGLSNIRAAITDGGVRFIYLTSFLYIIGMTLVTSFYGIFLVSVFHFSARETGLAFAAVGACVVFAQLVLLRLVIKKYDERTILRVSMLITATMIGLSAFMPTATLFVALIPLISMPHGLTLATLPALISKSSAAEKQGAALGVNASLVALATGLAPIAAGIGSGILGIRMPLLAGAMLLCCSWGALFVLASQKVSTLNSR